jgi:hypothetical protein
MDKNEKTTSDVGLTDSISALLGTLDQHMHMNDYSGLEVSKHHADTITAAIEKVREVLATRAPADLSGLTRAYNSGYKAGHHDTVEAQYTDIDQRDMLTYHADVVAELVADGTIPAAPSTKAAQPAAGQVPGLSLSNAEIDAIIRVLRSAPAGADWEAVDSASRYLQAWRARSAAPVPPVPAAEQPGDKLPKWIDALKGKDPTIDELIEYIIELNECFDAHLARQAQAGAVANLPLTAEDAIAFIGNHFDSMAEAADPMNVRFTLSVHDLLSAFRWWADADIAAPTSTDASAHNEAVAWMVLDCINFKPSSVTLDKADIEDHNPAHVVELVAAPKRVSAQAAQADVRDAALEEAEEGAQILDDLIKSVEQHGNYSKESTLVFLNQLKQCVDGTVRALRATRTPADDSQPAVGGA